MYKELEDLVVKAKSGDKKSKEIIIEKLSPLIIKSIRRNYNNLNEFEDLVQEGRVQVLQCIEDYDLNRETYFAGYVQAMLRYLYLNKHKVKKFASLNTKIGDQEDGELIDLIADDVDIEDLIIQEEIRDELYKALDKLTLRQKEVVYYFYFRRMAIKDIGQLLKISYRTVVNTKTQALDKIRKHL